MIICEAPSLVAPRDSLTTLYAVAMFFFNLANRQRINELSAISSELKQRLKNGEITQKEYIRERQPIHQEITSLLKEAQKRDPFTARFSQEINDCRYVMDKKSFIENI